MQIPLPKLALALAIVAGLAVPAAAQNLQRMGCHDLWVARNQIFKDNGYCFKTARAIREFGNAGCQYDRERDVPMTGQERRQVAQITQAEVANGCSATGRDAGSSGPPMQ